MSLTDADRDVLHAGVAGHDLTIAKRAEKSNLTTGEPDALLRESDVAFGQPNPADVIASQGLKWVHLSSAGYTRYDRDDVRAALRGRGGALTTSSSVYADPCAQHVLAMMLAVNRRLPHALRAQQDSTWAYAALRKSTRVLDGDRVLVVGFGSIGRRLVELLTPFQVDVTAVRRTVQGDEPVPTESMDQIDDLLPVADHVVNLLPAGANTRHFFNADRFARMHVGACFYNVGRGDTVDQDGLVSALQSQHLAAAYLDVTTPEPLPPEHPLWTIPNCFITPHIAGGHQSEHTQLVKHFLHNFGRYREGAMMRDRVI